MGWVDSHCHLQLDGRDPGGLLDRATEVDWVVVPGVDVASSRAAVELAARFPEKVVATAGVHPHHSDRWMTEAGEVLGLAGKVAAWGETGLDYYRDLSPREVQRNAFAGHIEAALDTGLPLVVHCRDAFADTFDMIEASGVGPQVVLHCWTGGPRWTRRFLQLGAVFSFAGPVAFETGSTVRLAAEQVPPERVLVETDTPYLAPPPHRGKPNEPAWVTLVGAALAAVWGMSLDTVARATTANAARLFRP